MTDAAEAVGTGSRRPRASRERLFYGGMADAIRAWLDGKPVRVIQ